MMSYRNESRYKGRKILKGMKDSSLESRMSTKRDWVLGNYELCFRRRVIQFQRTIRLPVTIDHGLHRVFIVKGYDKIRIRRTENTQF